ncbi:uncharacterized protein LOC117578801 [Drosophila guanche]|uniref:Uncharacterized protein n=1 Tax=Drosophila guanche TaxID=7266 RepID=A0A3B0JLN8_DROGU|nr:uncharacterized protein LOC117578801 [Drosophila guanche]SPP74439.1 Hypothetical predicted protein [Drosophila guanche]
MAENSGEQEISVSFSELESIDQEDIVILIDVASALKVCSECIRNKSVKTGTVLALWLKKVLGAYINEAVCCVPAFKEMCDWFQSMMSSRSVDCSDLITVLTEALHFMTTSKEKLQKAGGRLVHAAAYLLFSIVHGYLCESENNSNRNVLKGHIPNAIGLHSAVLSLLTEETASAKKVNPRITPLIKQMSEIAGFLGTKIIHLQAFIKTSKTMTYICLHYMQYVDRGHWEVGTMPDWLKETILHLCDTALNQMETIQKEETLTVPLGKVEEYLKVTHTYLLMLYELFKTELKYVDVSVSETLIDLLMSGTTTQDLGTDIPLLVSKYIRPCLLKLNELAYPLQHFQERLVASLIDPVEAEHDFFDLCLDFVAVVNLDNAVVAPYTCQTLQKIFEYIFRDASHFVNVDHYDRVIEAFSCLLCLAESEELNNYICTGVFQEDPVTSQACADILMLSFRLVELNPGWNRNTLVQATNYWNKCNNAYAMFSHNPSQWHVQRFLKYFHGLGKRELPPFSAQNYRYLHAVAPVDSRYGDSLLQRLQLMGSDPPNKIELYYEEVALMELLAQQTKTDCSKWLQQTFNFVQKLLGEEKYDSFTSVYFKLLGQASPSVQLQLLRGLAPVVGHYNWHVQKFLHACKNSNDAQLRAFSVRHSIDKEWHLLLQTVLHKLTPVTKAAVTNCKVLTKSSYKRETGHHCKAWSLKRKRSERTPKEIISELHDSSLLLGQSIAGLDAADREQVKRVVDNLCSILRAVDR